MVSQFLLVCMQRKMAQWVKGFVPKPDHLSSIPGTYITERELNAVLISTHACPHICTQNKCKQTDNNKAHISPGWDQCCTRMQCLTSMQAALQPILSITQNQAWWHMSECLSSSTLTAGRRMEVQDQLIVEHK